MITVIINHRKMMEKLTSVILKKEKLGSSLTRERNEYLNYWH